MVGALEMIQLYLKFIKVKLDAIGSHPWTDGSQVKLVCSGYRTPVLRAHMNEQVSERLTP